MDTLFTSLIYSITIAFCLIMAYDFINGLDRLTAVDNVIGYIEVRFTPTQPVEYTPLPKGYLHKLVASTEAPVICPQIVDITDVALEAQEKPQPETSIQYPTEVNPWDISTEKVAADVCRPLVGNSIAPTQLLLPPAPPELPVPIADHWSANPVDYSKLSSADLRKRCSDRKIRWRNTRGSGKHMTKAEMIAALSI